MCPQLRYASLLFIAVVLLPLSVSFPAESRRRAFPGAAGFGAFSQGGRGGRVLFVTNLRDSGPGSLRAAVEEKGPRFVLFRVAGVIELERTLDIREPYITIAAQTAPGQGVCLKNRGLSIRAHDVVIRHLRVRPGDEPGAAYKARGRGFSPDAITIATASRDVILDHCSASWSIDECCSVSGAGISNITVQWCIIAESLNDSFHPKGPHGYGSLIRCNGDVSFHHNLYAHHRSRSPRPGTYGPGSILLDFRNNVIYDSSGYSAEDPVRMNYVGNYIRRPNAAVFKVGGDTTRMFLSGNLVDHEGDVREVSWELVARETPANRRERAFPVEPVETQDAREAFVAVLRSSGAMLPQRDAVDARIVEQVEKGTGGLINSQKEVGGWPELRAADAPADSDDDGMPDAWEREHGLDPELSDHAGDADGDGYANLEEFLNRTSPRHTDRDS